jgi:hypothetical protein
MGNNGNETKAGVKILKHITFRIYRWDGANSMTLPGWESTRSRCIMA